MREGLKQASGRVLTRNALWNLLGLSIPLAVAVVATPPLISQLGLDRFGILALAWVLIGYFSIFDLGIGRALTQVVAERWATGEPNELAVTITTGVTLTLGLGLLGALAVGAVSPLLVNKVLRVPAQLQKESVLAFLLLALTIPVVISSAALRGVLEARQRFVLVNLVRIPIGAFQYLGPLMVLPFSHSLVAMVAVLALLRVLSWVSLLLMCLSVVPALRRGLAFERHLARQLVRLGSWMTVSNIVSPLMTFSDRFLVGALVSIAAVSYYATPNELITRVMVIPVALTGVLFPTFATDYRRDPQRTHYIFGSGVKYVFLALLPIVLLTIVFAKPALKTWLSPQFAQNSSFALQVLAVGVLFNGIAQLPFALIQGVGRPDLTAKLHIVEVPIYLALALILIRLDGINGAALAWSIRVVADAAALFFLAKRSVLHSAARSWPVTPIVWTIGLLIVGFGLARSEVNPFLGMLPIIGLYLVLASRILSSDERRSMLRLFAGRF